MYPTDPVGRTTWQAAMKHELYTIGPWKRVRALEVWEPVEGTAQAVRRLQLAYFQRQTERMRYPEYLRRGFPIGSGAVEGACKPVGVDRFRQGRMRWKLETADPVLHLRAALLTQPRLDLRAYAATQSPVAAA